MLASRTVIDFLQRDGMRLICKFQGLKQGNCHCPAGDRTALRLFKTVLEPPMTFQGGSRNEFKSWYLAQVTTLEKWMAEMNFVIRSVIWRLRPDRDHNFDQA